ncbi:serine hydrolase domain-containing protein [Sandarakinorhabdus sp. AAP62]|uniref:serine hydrolase domain-containing protein n=1 Tax=Sandarakinorhabdus sp. AAP62 TaxID=1248916 RepID=UPI0002EB126F|nr:serine hydrolase domain-containing protein [Sandarakinorhabdus sp. AAP62]
MRLALIALLMAAASLAAPGAPAVAAAAPLPEAERRAAVLAFLQARMARDQIPGLQIAVVQDGRILLNEALGMANLEQGIKVTPETRFSINSATKSITGVAAMQLVEAGTLDLDAPIGRYLTDLPAAWAAIPVRHLLSHQSGLPDIVDDDGVIGGSEAEAWAAVKARPVEAADGARFAYNQTNYALLGRIISQQAGMGFADVFQQRQFAPAGMRRTLFGDSDDIIPGRAPSYSFYRHIRGIGGKPGADVKGSVLGHWRDEFPPFMRAGAGIVTTATDLANWLVALEQGRLMKPETRTRMWQRDKLNDGKPGEWAMGWPVLESRGRRIVAGIGGARSAFFIYPDHGLSIVVLPNLAAANPQRFIDDVATIYLGSP